MADLVKRLRNPAYHPDGALSAVRTLDDMAEAADEIERLRQVGRALIDDVKKRYPGEELICPHMRALDELTKQE